MTTKAKSLSVVLAVLAAPWGIATMGLAGRAGRAHQAKNINAAQETDAAYRDGYFVGQLDGRQGRKAQPGIARWNTDKDRAVFTAGYKKGYSEALASARGERRR